MPSQPALDAAEPSPAPKPRSPAQIEASRINGARSRGPVTAEGKKRSSMNALRHGCATGNFVLLACEDQAAFQKLARQFEAGLGAIGEAERPLVGRMLRAEWRSRRIERIETLFFERAIEAVDGPDGDGRDADGKEIDPLAFLDSPRLRTLMRYMGAQRSELHRAHDAILRQRQACERTERHDKAMKEDQVCRGFYYGPAGRYPNHDPDWYPLSAESDTPPPFAGPIYEPPSAVHERTRAARRSPRGLQERTRAGQRRRAGFPRETRAPNRPGRRSAPSCASSRTNPSLWLSTCRRAGRASPTCRRRSWPCGATRPACACIRTRSSASSPPPGRPGTPIRDQRCLGGAAGGRGRLIRNVSRGTWPFRRRRAKRTRAPVPSAARHRRAPVQPCAAVDDRRSGRRGSGRMTGPVRVLVVGVGNMGQSHARAYHGNPGFELVGLMSRTIKEKPKGCRPSCRVSDVRGFRAGMRESMPNAVSINTYPDTHAEYAIPAMEGGCHVFMEKPIATTNEDAQAVVAKAEETHRKLVLGYILRVHPAWTKFIEIGRGLGKPLVMRMNLNQQSPARPGTGTEPDAIADAHRRLRRPLRRHDVPDDAGQAGARPRHRRQAGDGQRCRTTAICTSCSTTIRSAGTRPAGGR